MRQEIVSMIEMEIGKIKREHEQTIGYLKIDEKKLLELQAKVIRMKDELRNKESYARALRHLVELNPDDE